jgi:hypothetical protein
MEGECEVICGDCNAYLWSEAACDHEGKAAVVVPCPCTKKPGGGCSGQLKSDAARARRKP